MKQTVHVNSLPKRYDPRPLLVGRAPQDMPTLLLVHGAGLGRPQLNSKRAPPGSQTLTLLAAGRLPRLGTYRKNKLDNARDRIRSETKSCRGSAAWSPPIAIELIRGRKARIGSARKIRYRSVNTYEHRDDPFTAGIGIGGPLLG